MSATESVLFARSKAIAGRSAVATMRTRTFCGPSEPATQSIQDMARKRPGPRPLSQTESCRAALLAAVKEAPDDDTPRLVLADWLDEHGNADEGDCDHAELIVHGAFLLARRSRDALAASVSREPGAPRDSCCSTCLACAVPMCSRTSTARSSRIRLGEVNG